MSRIKRSKHKKNKFIVVILSVVILCALSLFVYSKFISNNSKNYSSSKNTSSATNNSKEDVSKNNAVNNTIASNDNNVAVSTNNSSKSSNVTSKNSATSSSNSASNKTATNKTNYVVELPSNAEASKGNGITVDKATELLTSKISSKNSQIKISYDHTQNKSNTNYYVFQALDSAGASSAGDTHSDTLAWYYVNTTNGDMFTYDLNNDVLAPLK